MAAGAVAAGAVAGGGPDLRAVAQAIGAVDDDGVAGAEAAQDDRVLAVARSQGDRMHRHRVLVDEEDVVAGRAAQHRGRRHQHRLMQRIDEQADIDEFIGKQDFVVVGESRPQGDGAGARGHLIVEGIERAGRKRLAAVAVVGSHRQLHARCPEPLDHFLEIVLGDRELDRRRLDGRDDGYARGRRAGDVVADVDQTQADPSGDRRGDAGIAEVEPGGVDRRLVELHRPLVLLDDVGLVFGLLARDGIQRDELLEAHEVHLRLVEQALIALQRADGLVERRLERARIDLRQQLAFLHVLAFLKGHVDEIAADGLVGHHGDRGRGHDGAQLVQHHRHVAQRRLGDLDDLRRRGSRWRLLGEFLPEDDAGHSQHERSHDPAQATETRVADHRCVRNFAHATASGRGTTARCGLSMGV